MSELRAALTIDSRRFNYGLTCATIATLRFVRAMTDGAKARRKISRRISNLAAHRRRAAHV